MEETLGLGVRSGGCRGEGKVGAGQWVATSVAPHTPPLHTLLDPRRKRGWECAGSYRRPLPRRVLNLLESSVLDDAGLGISPELGLPLPALVPEPLLPLAGARMVLVPLGPPVAHLLVPPVPRRQEARAHPKRHPRQHRLLRDVQVPLAQAYELHHAVVVAGTVLVVDLYLVRRPLAAPVVPVRAEGPARLGSARPPAAPPGGGARRLRRWPPRRRLRRPPAPCPPPYLGDLLLRLRPGPKLRGRPTSPPPMGACSGERGRAGDGRRSRRAGPRPSAPSRPSGPAARRRRRGDVLW